MKDYKILFGYAAVLLSIGFVIRSITFAYAYPTGPSVSMGSNPVVSFTGYGTSLIHTVPSDKIFVITDINLSYAGSTGSTQTYLQDENGTKKGSFRVSGSTRNRDISLANGIPFEPESEVHLVGNAVHCTVSGYYAHP
jgi:hypothetical protein